MDQLSRRQLLGRALAAGAGATVLAPFASPDVAAAASSGSLRGFDSLIDPGFIAGRIVDQGAGVFVVSDPDGQLRRIRVPTTGRVWREGLWNSKPLTVGDCLYARGTIAADGVLEVANTWVGIFNSSGTIASTRGGSVDITIDSGGTLAMAVEGVTRHQDSGRQVEGEGLGNAVSGDYARVIGYHDNKNDNLVAVTVMHGGGVPAPGEDVTQRKGRTAATLFAAPTATCPCLVEGVATWQCCGGVNACGSAAFAACNPPPSSHGACNTCRTDQQGVAWPNIINAGGQVCQPTPSSCATTLDRFNCGKSVGFTNKCNGVQIFAPVNDCGPTIHCVVANRCMGYQTVKFDLTACSFTALGGSLSAGLIDVWATY